MRALKAYYMFFLLLLSYMISYLGLELKLYLIYK